MTEWLLVAGLALALATLAVLAVALRRAGARIRALEADLEALRTTRPVRPSQAAQVAGAVVRTMVDTAERVRERGVSGMLLASIEDFTRWTTEDRAQIRDIADADGNVTFMFSDIENSTALNADLGDERWVRLLDEHDRLVRRRIEEYGGHIVKSQGDGFMVVFGSPLIAVDACLAVQDDLLRGRGRQLRRTPIRVRMGLHTGTAIAREGDWFGAAVATAARVAARADGGSVLTTDAVHDGVGDAEAFTFEAAGITQLKGLPGTHRLWRVRRTDETTAAIEG
ncbi:adenylate/guanylate cyclase domain-containing protein [Nocardioides limicola]|uniref:adenylate/guanylate cyclase domain-containing protein n=1 Tax=Nocardioides limicola TaxID=2803368 RepID=UPI00193C5F54|nr:adenylate/guanylate cyclase domain-containing protein [Nocardioides sp. DJM-14]